MADFSTSASLEVRVDQRSLRSAKQTIEDELGSVEVGVSTTSDSLANRGGRGGGRMARRSLSLDKERNSLGQERNDLLEELLDQTEDNGFARALNGGGGGGGGGGGAGGAIGALAGLAGAAAGATAALTGLAAAAKGSDPPEKPPKRPPGKGTIPQDPFEDVNPDGTPKGGPAPDPTGPPSPITPPTPDGPSSPGIPANAFVTGDVNIDGTRKTPSPSPLPTVIPTGGPDPFSQDIFNQRQRQQNAGAGAAAGAGLAGVLFGGAGVSALFPGLFAGGAATAATTGGGVSAPLLYSKLFGNGSGSGENGTPTLIPTPTERTQFGNRRGGNNSFGMGYDQIPQTTINVDAPTNVTVEATDTQAVDKKIEEKQRQQRREIIQQINRAFDDGVSTSGGF